MKCFKIFSVLAIAALLCTPAALMAKSPKVSLSFNFDCFPKPMLPPYPVVVEERVIEEYYYYAPPPPPPYIERETIIRRDYVGSYPYPPRPMYPNPYYR